VQATADAATPPVGDADRAATGPPCCRFQVPANRAGYSGGLTGYQLKIIQEVITLIVFVGFATFVLREKPTWNYVVSFAFLALAAFFAFGFGKAQTVTS
jgi:hypothetical protein